MSLSKEEYNSHVRSVWKVTLLLAIVTVVEVAIAILYDELLTGVSGMRISLNVLMIVFSAIKAFYIVNVFMHLKYEKTMMVVTILAPLLFFIWFIIAFLMEGSAWHEMRGL